MRLNPAKAAKSIGSGFFIQHRPRPLKAYHLRFEDPISWTYARDVQNTVIKAYQAHHHLGLSRKPLPPTFITLRFLPVFTYGRRDERPTARDRRILEGLPGRDGSVVETRMAWSRESGWQFHGPGQIHCWMVADLMDWRVRHCYHEANYSGKLL